MILSTDSKYPSRRTYGAKLRSDATPHAFVAGLVLLVGSTCAVAGSPSSAENLAPVFSQVSAAVVAAFQNEELLLGGDVIVAVEGIAIGAPDAYETIRHRMTELRAASGTVHITLLRGGETLELAVKGSIDRVESTLKQALQRIESVRGGVMKGIASMADVLDIERRRPSLPNSTYEMIRAATSAHAKAPALSFFLRVQDTRGRRPGPTSPFSPASPPPPTSSAASASARTT